MVPFTPWTVAEILAYLDRYQGTIVLTGDRASLDLPKYPCDKWGNWIKREKIVDEILPHMIARREELIEWCRNSDPDYRDKVARGLGYADHADRSEVEAATRTARAESFKLTGDKLIRRWAIESVFKRAAGRAVYAMGAPHYVAIKVGTAADVPDTARFVCVAGDESWQEIARIVPDPDPPKERRAKGKKTRERNLAAKREREQAAEEFAEQAAGE